MIRNAWHGLPLITSVTSAGIARLGQGGAMGVTHIGFLVTKKGGADLHSAGAEYEVRPSATRRRRRPGAAPRRRLAATIPHGVAQDVRDPP